MTSKDLLIDNLGSLEPINNAKGKPRKCFGAIASFCLPHNGKIISVRHDGCNNMIADTFTKPLQKPTFVKQTKSGGISYWMVSNKGLYGSEHKLDLSQLQQHIDKTFPCLITSQSVNSLSEVKQL